MSSMNPVYKDTDTFPEDGAGPVDEAPLTGPAHTKHTSRQAMVGNSLTVNKTRKTGRAYDRRSTLHADTQSRISVYALPRDVRETFAKFVQSEEDGDFIDVKDLAAAGRQYTTVAASRKRFRNVLIGLLFLVLGLLGAFGALTFLVVEMAKDVRYTTEGTATIKGTDKPVTIENPHFHVSNRTKKITSDSSDTVVEDPESSAMVDNAGNIVITAPPTNNDRVLTDAKGQEVSTKTKRYKYQLKSKERAQVVDPDKYGGMMGLIEKTRKELDTIISLAMDRDEVAFNLPVNGWNYEQYWLAGPNMTVVPPSMKDTFPAEHYRRLVMMLKLSSTHTTYKELVVCVIADMPAGSTVHKLYQKVDLLTADQVHLYNIHSEKSILRLKMTRSPKLHSSSPSPSSSSRRRSLLQSFSFSDIGDGLSSAGSAVGDGLSSAGGHVVDGASFVVDVGGSAVEGGAALATSGVGFVGDHASNGVDWMADAGSDGLDWAGDAGSDGLEWAGDSVVGISEDFWEMNGDWITATIDTFEDISDWVLDGYNGPSIGDVLEDIGEGILNLPDTIYDFVTEGIPDAFEGLLESLNDVFTWLLTTTSIPLFDTPLCLPMPSDRFIIADPYRGRKEYSYEGTEICLQVVDWELNFGGFGGMFNEITPMIAEILEPILLNMKEEIRQFTNEWMPGIGIARDIIGSIAEVVEAFDSGKRKLLEGRSLLEEHPTGHFMAEMEKHLHKHDAKGQKLLIEFAEAFDGALSKMRMRIHKEGEEFMHRKLQQESEGAATGDNPISVFKKFKVEITLNLHYYERDVDVRFYVENDKTDVRNWEKIWALPFPGMAFLTFRIKAQSIAKNNRLKLGAPGHVKDMYLGEDPHLMSFEWVVHHEGLKLGVDFFAMAPWNDEDYEAMVIEAGTVTGHVVPLAGTGRCSIKLQHNQNFFLRAGLCLFGSICQDIVLDIRFEHAIGIDMLATTTQHVLAHPEDSALGKLIPILSQGISDYSDEVKAEVDACISSHEQAGLGYSAGGVYVYSKWPWIRVAKGDPFNANGRGDIYYEFLKTEPIFAKTLTHWCSDESGESLGDLTNYQNHQSVAAQVAQGITDPTELTVAQLEEGIVDPETTYWGPGTTDIQPNGQHTEAWIVEHGWTFSFDIDAFLSALLSGNLEGAGGMIVDAGLALHQSMVEVTVLDSPAIAECEGSACAAGFTSNFESIFMSLGDGHCLDPSGGTPMDFQDQSLVIHTRVQCDALAATIGGAVGYEWQGLGVGSPQTVCKVFMEEVASADGSAGTSCFKIDPANVQGPSIFELSMQDSWIREWASQREPAQDVGSAPYSVSADGCKNCGEGGYTCALENPYLDCQVYCNTFERCIGFFFHVQGDSEGRCCPVQTQPHFSDSENLNVAYAQAVDHIECPLNAKIIHADTGRIINPFSPASKMGPVWAFKEVHNDHCVILVMNIYGVHLYTRVTDPYNCGQNFDANQNDIWQSAEEVDLTEYTVHSVHYSPYNCDDMEEPFPGYRRQIGHTVDDYFISTTISTLNDGTTSPYDPGLPELEAMQICAEKCNADPDCSTIVFQFDNGCVFKNGKGSVETNLLSAAGEVTYMGDRPAATVEGWTGRWTGLPRTHIGGDSVMVLGDGTMNGWIPSTASLTGSVEVCVSRCEYDPECTAVIHKRSNRACYWKKNWFGSTESSTMHGPADYLPGMGPGGVTGMAYDSYIPARPTGPWTTEGPHNACMESPRYAEYTDARAEAYCKARFGPNGWRGVPIYQEHAVGRLFKCTFNGDLLDHLNPWIRISDGRVYHWHDGFAWHYDSDRMTHYESAPATCTFFISGYYKSHNGTFVGTRSDKGDFDDPFECATQCDLDADCQAWSYVDRNCYTYRYEHMQTATLHFERNGISYIKSAPYGRFTRGAVNAHPSSSTVAGSPPCIPFNAPNADIALKECMADCVALPDTCHGFWVYPYGRCCLKNTFVSTLVNSHTGEWWEEAPVTAAVPFAVAPGWWRYGHQCEGDYATHVATEMNCKRAARNLNLEWSGPTSSNGDPPGCFVIPSLSRVYFNRYKMAETSGTHSGRKAMCERTYGTYAEPPEDSEDASAEGRRLLEEDEDMRSQEAVYSNVFQILQEEEELMVDDEPISPDPELVANATLHEPFVNMTDYLELPDVYNDPTLFEPSGNETEYFLLSDVQANPIATDEYDDDDEGEEQYPGMKGGTALEKQNVAKDGCTVKGFFRTSKDCLSKCCGRCAQLTKLFDKLWRCTTS